MEKCFYSIRSSEWNDSDTNTHKSSSHLSLSLFSLYLKKWNGEMLLFNSIKWMKRDLKFGLILEKEEEEGGRKMRKRVGMKWLRLSAALIWYSWYFALKSMLPSKPGSFLTPPFPSKAVSSILAKLLSLVQLFVHCKTFKECSRIFEQENLSMFWKRWKTCSERNVNDRVKFNNAFEIGQISFTLPSSTLIIWQFQLFPLLTQIHFVRVLSFARKKSWTYSTLLFCFPFCR